METVLQDAVGLVGAWCRLAFANTVPVSTRKGVAHMGCGRAGRSEPRMISFFTQTQQGVLAALFFVVGVVVGRLASLWSIALTRAATTADSADTFAPQNLTIPESVSRDVESNACVSPDVAVTAEPAEAAPNQTPQPNPTPDPAGLQHDWLGRGFGLGRGIVEIVTGLLFAGYVIAYLRFHCQELAEVRPDDVWLYGRMIYQLILISLLVAATATDLRDFVIPDQITVPGALVGIAGATLSGQLQMVHVWVDWNQEIPGIAGPFIPDWLDPHRHWHGLVWSLAGAVCGAGLTWLVRFCSSRILGREALGLGDVTLMGLIGSYLGWQPTVFVFLIAPLVGMLLILPIKLVWKRAYVPYGPFLAAATIVVLVSWKWLWLSSRLVFGDPRSLLLLATGALIALLVLLCALRLYQWIREPEQPSGD
jgi:leader peptidase (prepilin peptidase)/N-methyltransferase